MEAVTQSAIQLKLHNIHNGTTTIQIANAYHNAITQTSGLNVGDQLPPISVIMAMQFGVAFESGLDNMFSPGFRVNCPTGNCTFPTYQTLTIYTDCYDRSNSLTNKTDNSGNTYTTLPLPGSGELGLLRNSSSGTVAIVAANSSTAYPDPSVFVHPIGPLISTVTTILDFWNGNPVAVQCAYYWSVQTYDGVVNVTTNGELWEEPRQTSLMKQSGQTTYQQLDNVTMQPDECWINGTLFTQKTSTGDWASPNCQYVIANFAQAGVQNIFLDPDYGFNGEALQYGPHNFSRQNDYIRNVYGVSEQSTRAEAISNIMTLSTNAGVMMSKALRVSSGGAQLTSIGFVFSSDFFYHILWYHLALPIALVFGSLVFLLVTMLSSRNVLKWKRSSLPLIFHGLGNKEREAVTHVHEYADMKDIAENMSVKLQRTKEGVRLVSGVDTRFGA
jgi:hypothetical protein